MPRVKIAVFFVLSLLLLGCMLPVAASAGELEDAVDNPVQTDGVTALVFTTQSGTTATEALWTADTTTFYTGGAAAKSGHISGNMYSTLTTTVTGPASVSFYQKISSQAGYDTLKFMINGVVKSTISGERDWQQKAFVLPAGTFTLQWKYSKNATIDKGSDAVWVDKVVVSPNSSVKVTAPNGGESLYSGDTMTITWNATAAAEKYKLYYATNGSTYLPFIIDPNNPYYVPAPGFSQTYTATVPAPATGNTALAKVKVMAYNNANVLVGQDISDLAFRITVIKVTTPNVGDTLNAKTTPTVPINFTIYGQPKAATATITSSLSSVPIAIMPVTGPGDYTYAWNVPAVTVKKNATIKVVIKSATGATLGTAASANFIITPVFSISGAVTLAGKPLSGATVDLSGADAQTATTDSLGKYSFTKLLPNTYMVSCSKTGNVISPASIIVPVTAANITGKNFTATTVGIALHSISGTVSGATGTGVTIMLTGTMQGAVMTAADGTYAFNNLPEGNYSVTPVKAGYIFDPVVSGAYLADDRTDINFTSSPGTAGTYSISGKVTYGGGGISGIAVAASGPMNATVVTDPLGNYSLTGLSSGAYVITPSATGFDFTPVNRSVAANITSLNFAAGRNMSALSGSYRVLQQSAGFFLYTGLSTATAAGSYTNGYTAIWSFDGAGNCTARDDGGTEYSMTNDPSNVLVTATTPTTSTIPCTYTMVPDGTAVISIKGFQLPVWLSMDGNTFIWGGGGWDNGSILGGAIPVLNGGLVYGEQAVGVKMATSMSTASVNGTYRLVQQAERFGLTGTPSGWSQVEGYTGSMTFDGQGSCAVHYDPAATYNMSEPNSITRFLHSAGDGQCTYTVAADGTATVSFNGFNVPVWFSADGNTFVWDSDLTSIGAAPVLNGDAVGHEQVVGVRAGTGMKTSSLNGRYKVVQQSLGFGFAGNSVSTIAYSYENGYTTTVTFNGAGSCSFHDDSGTEYSATNDPGNIIRNISGPNTGGCTYSVAGNGTTTVTIGGFHVPVWLSSDGNTFIWGGSGWSNSSIAGGAYPVVNGGPVYVEQSVGVRAGDPLPPIGSWLVTNPTDEGDTGVLTIINGSTFMYAETGPNPPSDSWPGIEYGSYTATASTLKPSVIADTNGGWGMSNLAGRNVPYSISGPFLTIGADLNANAILKKILPSQNNPLVGSWLVSPASGGPAGHYGVLTVIDDTRFVYAEYGPADAGGSSGMEYGNYTWTATTFNPTAFITDTNGNWGFSDATGMDLFYTVSGNDLTINGNVVFTRIQ